MLGIMRRTSLLLGVCLFGCTADDPEVGNDPSQDVEPDPQPQAATLVGTWTGYVENHVFDDLSDRVELTVVTESGGVVSGKIRFGEHALYPPPTDPDAGYPPGYASSWESLSVSHPYSGFEFTLVDGTFEDGRLRFSVNRYEIWTAWCDLQTPVFDDFNQSYMCVPNWGSAGGDAGCSQPDPETGTYVPVDCVKLQLCESRVCECTAADCAIETGPNLPFDLAVDLTAGSANGSAEQLDNHADFRIVRLTRDDP